MVDTLENRVINRKDPEPKKVGTLPSPLRMECHNNSLDLLNYIHFSNPIMDHVSFTIPSQSKQQLLLLQQ